MPSDSWIGYFTTGVKCTRTCWIADQIEIHSLELIDEKLARLGRLAKEEDENQLQLQNWMDHLLNGNRKTEAKNAARSSRRTTNCVNIPVPNAMLVTSSASPSPFSTDLSPGTSLPRRPFFRAVPQVPVKADQDAHAPSEKMLPDSAVLSR